MATTSDSAPSDDDFARTRRSIIDRLGDWEDRGAWDRFYRTYGKVIHAFARKHGLRDDEAFDVVQETVLGIARQARDGRYDPAAGNFKNWLFQQTRWRIADHFRARAPEAALPEDADSTRTPHVERLPDPAAVDAVWDAEWRTNALEVARERVKGKVSPRQFQIFDLAVAQEWPVARIRETLEVSAAQVYLARHRVGSLLKKELRQIDERAL